MKFVTNFLEERIGYDFYCDVAERIVEARKEKGWTQEDLASAAGVGLSRIANMETVKVRFTLTDIENLAEALGVKVDWLISAELDYGGEDCLYHVWNEKYEDFKLYAKASSARRAFLNKYQSVQVDGGMIWFEPRDRARVKLVGIPIKKSEMEAKFRKTEDPGNSPIEKDCEAS